MTENKRYCRLDDFEHWNVVKDNVTTEIYDDAKDIADLLNELYEKNDQLRNRIKDWHQRAFKAHEYFNVLEKVIDEVCNDDISDQIWEEYEKREKLIE